MTENEEREMNNPLPHILEFLRIRIRWDIIDAPRRVVRWLKEQGWRITFGLMNSSMRKSTKNLEAIKKSLKFRDWMFGRIIKYMTEDQFWILSITHPEEEKHWVQLAFTNPNFVEVNLVDMGDGKTGIQSITPLPPQGEKLITDWHIVNEEHLNHILKLQARREAEEEGE